MRATFILICAVCISCLAVAGEVQVQNPVLTLTGHCRSRDVRVREHKFPVEIRLPADGKFTGTFESWIEERLSDGTSLLDYFNDTFSKKLDL